MPGKPRYKPRPLPKDPEIVPEIQTSNFRHGMDALAKRGEAALSDTGLSRLQELRAQFESEPGRVEYRKELAAFIAMILELGFSNLREIADDGGNIWVSAPIRSMGTYLNTLTRLLDNWPKEDRPRDITSILEGMSREAEGGDHGRD